MMQSIKDLNQKSKYTGDVSSPMFTALKIKTSGR